MAPKAFDPAVDVVIARAQPYAFHPRAHFQRARGALHLEVLDEGHGVAVGQQIAVGVAHQ